MRFLLILLCVLVTNSITVTLPGGQVSVGNSTWNFDASTWTAAAPSYVPPARKYFPLSFNTDRTNLFVSLTLGTSQTAATAQTLNVIFDTGSAGLFVFNHTLCINSNSLHNIASCFASSASATWQDVSPFANTFGLLVDGERVNDTTATGGIDTATLALSLVGSTNKQQLTATVPVLVGNWLQRSTTTPVLHSLVDSDGVIGAAYSSLAPAGSALLTLLNPESDVSLLPWLTLDFSPLTGQNFVYVGGIKESTRSNLQWGLRPPTFDATLQAYHQFPIFAMQTCGVTLPTANSSQPSVPYRAIIDSGASCLSVPPALFASISAYLPLVCTGDKAVCYVPANSRVAQPQPLPTIDFQMSSNASAPWMHIALEPLLNSSGTSRRLCLRPDPSTTDTITFGTQALMSFVVTLDMDHGAVALANKLYFNPSTVQCVLPRQCRGMQTQYAPLNMCVDPPCYQYYMLDFDDDTKECKLSNVFHAFVIIGAIIFAVMEVGLNELQIRLSNRAISTVELQ